MHLYLIFHTIFTLRQNNYSYKLEYVSVLNKAQSFDKLEKTQSINDQETEKKLNVLFQNDYKTGDVLFLIIF